MNTLMNLSVEIIDKLNKEEMLSVYGGSVVRIAAVNNGNGTCHGGPNNSGGTCHGGPNNGSGVCYNEVK